MTNILYEKQGSYLQGREDKALEDAKILINAGKLTPEEAVNLLHVSLKDLNSKRK
jgi:hypothetical protein